MSAKSMTRSEKFNNCGAFAGSNQKNFTTDMMRERQQP